MEILESINALQSAVDTLTNIASFLPVLFVAGFGSIVYLSVNWN